MLSDIKMDSSTVQNPASFVWIELTNKCNLECGHCYNSSGPYASDGSLSQPQYEDVIDQAASMGCRGVQFIGGEPTLSKSLIPLIDHAFLRGIVDIEIYSNLISVSDALLDAASRCNARFATSFYSDDSAVHDEITKRPGSFSRTTANIRKILDRGLFVRAGFIEMIENTGHFDRSVSFLNQIGVSEIGYDRIRKIGRASESKCDELSELCGRCGEGSLCINYDGSISPCIMSKFVQLGEIHKHSLSEIANGSSLREFRAKLASDEDCHPQCVPVCNPQCSPACSPCYPHGKCDPELFRG